MYCISFSYYRHNCFILILQVAVVSTKIATKPQMYPPNLDVFCFLPLLPAQTSALWPPTRKYL